MLSYLLYPQVFLDFQHAAQFGDTSTVPTSNFFYGLRPGEEASIEIERGKTLIVKFPTMARCVKTARARCSSS